MRRTKYIQALENDDDAQKTTQVIKEITGAICDDHFDAIQQRREEDEEFRQSFREAFTAILAALANYLIAGIEDDDAFDNTEKAFGDVIYVLKNVLYEMSEDEKALCSPILATACDLALDAESSVEIARQCYALIESLLSSCVANQRYFGDEILNEETANSAGKDSQIGASRLKKLARQFKSCGDFECQKSIVSIALKLLDGSDSFNSETDVGMDSIRTLFPKRSDELLQLRESMKSSKGMKNKQSSGGKFVILVEFVRQSNFALGSEASVHSFDCDNVIFGDYKLAEKMVHFSNNHITVSVYLDSEEPDVATAVDIGDDNIRVAAFDEITNTLTIGIYKSCEGMLERDEFDANDDSWIAFTFQKKDVPSVKQRIESFATTENCEAMKILSTRLKETAGTGKKVSRIAAVNPDLIELEPEGDDDLMEEETEVPTLPKNPPRSGKSPKSSLDITQKTKPSAGKKTPPVTADVEKPPLASSKPTRKAKENAQARISAQTAAERAYNSAKKYENEDGVDEEANKKKKNVVVAASTLKDCFANEVETEDDEEEILDQSGESPGVDEMEDIGKNDDGPSFEEEEEEEEGEAPKKTENKRGGKGGNLKTPAATIKVPKTAPLPKRELHDAKSTRKTKVLKDTAGATTTLTGHAATAVGLATTKKKKKGDWRLQLTTLDVDDDDEENNNAAEKANDDKTQKGTIGYKAKVERQLKFPSGGNKNDDATTLKRKVKQDRKTKKDDELAYSDDDEDDDDDDDLSFSSDNDSDERGKKRAKLTGKNKKAVGAGKGKDVGGFRAGTPEDYSFDAIRNAMETLKRTKTNEAESRIEKMSKNLEIEAEKSSIRLAQQTSENLAIAKLSFDETAKRLEKDETKIRAHIEDLTAKFSREIDREVDLLSAVKSKAKAATKNAQEILKSLREEASEEQESFNAQMRDKIAKLKRETIKIRRQCAEQTDLKKMLLNMAEMI